MVKEKKHRNWASCGVIAYLFWVFHLLLWPAFWVQSTVAAPVKPAYKDAPKAEKRTKLRVEDSLQGLERVAHRIRRGETLGKLFRRQKLSTRERVLWLRTVRKHLSPRKIRAGREIAFYFHRDIVAGAKSRPTLLALEIQVSDDWVWSWQKKGKRVVFGKRERPYQINFITVAGTIDDSLYEDGIHLGMPPAVISQFVEIFAWDVNFQTDLREGDSFKVFFRRKHRNGDGAHASFRILVAELTNRGRKYSALYFQQKEKEGHYYDLEGRPRGRSFLRYPVKFSRISSTFRHARFHPILKIRRPHRGVDFVAKRGTPVRAVGSGTITHAGWKRGGYGRFIEIQHSPGFRTRYAHLHKFARGIRRGRTVEKGQVIGYVGCSGLCTGPHLHFELYKNQRYRDPLKIKLPPAERIEPKLRKVFENAKQRLLTELADSRAS